MASTIRLATQSDAAHVQAIYAPIVRDTAISFEIDPPSVDEMYHTRPRGRTTAGGKKAGE